jgi:hypothetical protein
MRLLVFTSTLLVALASASPHAAAQRMGTPWPDGEAIERFLREAKITERKKLGEGITNPEKVTLELDGVVRNAIFKKVDKDHDSWRNEVAAYELDKVLAGWSHHNPPAASGRKGCSALGDGIGDGQVRRVSRSRRRQVR